ncbi:MAG: sigma-54 dependent transcriptional regulator [Sandaracinaceae bacterium]|nr:sigma-54 dependent transcriptional regulator [Sandaracinaceae bacterium]
MSARVLIVEDERAIGLALTSLLERDGYRVTVATSGDDACRALDGEAFDLVLTDLALGKGKTGLDVLSRAKAIRAETPVVMITAHGSEKIAVEAIKAGAEDYVPKPFDNDEIRLVVARALERTRVAREHRLLLERIARDHAFGALVGSGPAMQRVFETIRKVAETDLTVLIRGESGTGKELVAEALHTASPRAARPFVAVNCAAISRELVESELFGHEKGAFTGADARRAGRFEAAHGGTIFLDEIGDMPLETQAKVLRVLESRTLERVGSTKSVAVDVRVVAATHRDLEADVEQGRFRRDLYYRLRVVEAVLPPLRERLEDVPLLAERFLRRVAERLSRSPKTLTDGALARLVRHPWPGNVRELKNVLERAAVLAPSEAIDEHDLDLGGAPGRAGTAPSTAVPFAEAKRRAVADWERAYLTEALRQNDGNVSRTAEAIGMVRQSLQQKLRELEIRPEPAKGAGS